MGSLTKGFKYFPLGLKIRCGEHKQKKNKRMYLRKN